MEDISFRPQAGPQERFLASSADIAIYGGAAGAGKTFALLIEPLRHIANPAFGCVIFRRTVPQITAEGGMWDKAFQIYPHFSAKVNQNDMTWTFPSGARVTFAHLQYETTKFNWQGSEIALMDFDELTHFTEGQFFYMLSRNRSTSGVRPYVRASTNPDADSWVARFIAWWIDQDTGFPIPARAGVVRWFVRVNDQLDWADTPEELTARHGLEAAPKSVTFVPGRVYDNRILMEKDPGYLANLKALPLVDQERLLGGNWKVRPAAGKVFNRLWYDVVDETPVGGVFCLCWDFASTEKKLSKNDPDFTAAALVQKTRGLTYVHDCIAVQEGPAEVEELFRNYSNQCAGIARRYGARYRVRFEEEPGSASKRDSRRLVAMLPKLDVAAVVNREDKLTRAKPFAAQSRAGNVKVKRGEWNEMWLHHLHHQPDLPHDDVMDATVGAYNDLADEAVNAVRNVD